MQKYLHILKIHVKMMNEGESPVFHHGNEAPLNKPTVYTIKFTKNEIHTKLKL